VASDEPHCPSWQRTPPNEHDLAPRHVAQALKDHIEKRVRDGDFASRSDYARSLVRAERANREKRAELLRNIDLCLVDIEAGRIHDGEQVFAELLGKRETAA
jgi:Arc/MetJ-type ribon-helix-helix transcriptional regulator